MGHACENPSHACCRCYLLLPGRQLRIPPVPAPVPAPLPAPPTGVPQPAAPTDHGARPVHGLHAAQAGVARADGGSRRRRGAPAGHQVRVAAPRPGLCAPGAGRAGLPEAAWLQSGHRPGQGDSGAIRMRRHAQAAAAYAAGRPCGRCNSHITVLHLVAARERGARACLTLHISRARALALLLCVLRTETAAGGRHLARLRSRPLPLWLSSRPLTRTTWRIPAATTPAAAGSIGTRTSTLRRSRRCPRSGSRPPGAGAAWPCWLRAACWSAPRCCACDAEPTAAVARRALSLLPACPRQLSLL